jgi:hypothetical protein
MGGRAVLHRGQAEAAPGDTVTGQKRSPDHGAGVEQQH